LTQGKFGKKLGISQKTVSNILQADQLGRHIRSDTIDAVAEALGIDSWKLLVPDIPIDLLANRQMESVLYNFVASPPDGRKSITRIAEREAAYQVTPPTEPEDDQGPDAKPKKTG